MRSANRRETTGPFVYSGRRGLMPTNIAKHACPLAGRFKALQSEEQRFCGVMRIPTGNLGATSRAPNGPRYDAFCR